MMKLTCVIAIKNKLEKTVRRCIEGLLNQTYPCNITVVDFGSSKENLVWERKL